MSGNLSPSLVRTAVPFLVGGLGSWLTRQGLDINDDGAATLLTMVIGFVFYAVVRFLEVFAGPKWGYILGIAKSPGYTPGDPAKPAPVNSQHGEYPAADHGRGEVRLILCVAAAIFVAYVLFAILSGAL